MDNINNKQKTVINGINALKKNEPPTIIVNISVSVDDVFKFCPEAVSSLSGKKKFGSIIIFISSENVQMNSKI
jgi:hypothetical protein